MKGGRISIICNLMHLQSGKVASRCDVHNRLNDDTMRECDTMLLLLLVGRQYILGQFSFGR